jgi:alkylhydroperoxidase family enzyme
METVPARLAHPQRRGFMRYHLEEPHMRIPFISPAELNSDQRPLYDDMRNGIEKNFRGFIAVRSTGQLIGPWAPWIRFPKFGRPVWELLKALSSTPTLTRSVREIAILVVGAAFRSGYEIYAHANVAELTGFSEERIATISAGQRPADLTREEAVAFDIASALVSGGVLPEPTYQQAVRLFGDDSTAELMYLIGFYCLVSVCLNGFDVPVPEVNARY